MADEIRLKVTEDELETLTELLLAGLPNYSAEQVDLAQHFYERFSLALNNRRMRKLVSSFRHQ